MLNSLCEIAYVLEQPQSHPLNWLPGSLSWHLWFMRHLYHLLRGSAKQSVKDGLGSLWQHWNFKTSQLQNLSSYNDENFARMITSVRRTHLSSLVGIRPLGVVPRMREIYTTCDFSSFLPSFVPSCLFSCAPAQAKRIGLEIISRTMAQKTQFGVRKCPPNKCFSLIWSFVGYFPPKYQNFAYLK